MNYLTAYRSFGNPGFSPAKGIRIYKDRWYLVTMQNTSRDQGDGYYLEEGEYVELVPGDEARQRRDARLNHCNSIQEYNGPVYCVYVPGKNHWPYIKRYATSEQEANMIAQEMREHMEYERDKAIQYLEKKASMSDAEIVKMYHQCSNWSGDDRAEIEKYRKETAESIARYQNDYVTDVVIDLIRKGSSEKLESAHSAVTESGVTIEYIRDWTWITFPEKPKQEIIERLKELGGRWSSKRASWYFVRHITPEEIGV